MAVELGRYMSAGDADTPLSLELIADLHAGALSDDEAAVVRDRIASDPDAARAFAALDAVQADLAELNSAPAGEPPAEVTDSVAAALRAQSRHEVTGSRPGATHAARPSRSPIRTAGVIAGVIAVVLAVGVGTTALLRLPSSPGASAGESAKHITVDPPDPAMPLSDDEILALLDTPPDFGPLGDPQRRASCLDGLGYGVGAAVLGAAPVQVDRVDAVLLVLRSETPGQLVALVVPASCSAVNTGLIADRVLEAP